MGGIASKALLVTECLITVQMVKGMRTIVDRIIKAG